MSEPTMSERTMTEPTMTEPTSWPDCAPSLDENAVRYLDLLRRTLTRELFLDTELADVDLDDFPGGREAALELLRPNRWRLVEPSRRPHERSSGRDWPPTAETMIGTARLENVLASVCGVIEAGVPGDLIETGVWRGGATILMKAVVDAYGDRDRKVWVADSFEGLPVPDQDRYPADTVDWSHVKALAVDADQVRANFERFGLLDDRVRFLEGWFSDTLPDAPIDRLAVLRLDGDLYESTMDALVNLHSKVSPGGVVIVDDYWGWEQCRAAVDDFRRAEGIEASMTTVDWTGVWWQEPVA